MIILKTDTSDSKINCYWYSHNLYCAYKADIMYIRIVFLTSDLKMSMSFRFLSSGGTIFHTLDAKYRKKCQPKWVVLAELTEKSIWDLKL